ncbi:protein jagged-2-like [Saccostrea cucullata]|uniref:protein jagged-2-like n=1 Tax=Saccostrea cuccullata TaxID=36930 RepID=UPI002ED26F51
MKESSLWIIFVISQTIQPLAALGLLSLQLDSYSNPDGKTSDGSCCEHIFSIFGCSSGDCDPAFTICIHDTTQTGSCSVLRYKAGPYDDTGSVSFGTKLGALENPIQIPFQIWKSQFTISIAVYDDDSDGGHDHIGTITLTPNKAPGYNGSNTAFTDNFSSGYARIQMLYDIHCLENYYGQDCTTFCQPDGIHYVCDSVGNKVCLSGKKWK